MRVAKRGRLRMSIFSSIRPRTTVFGLLQFMDAYEAIRKTVGEDVEGGYSTREGLSP
jgi:hypothetical protein